MLNPLNHPVCFTYPHRLVQPSAWVEHIPFAMLLIDIIRPTILVELGTHSGNSYCAFCQAVKELRIDAKCFAVDSWEGDPHSGEYGPEVLGDLRLHHDPLYGSFSRLVQSTFDEAVNHFGDQTIDLLHIDGLHTYEAVKHDFETWLPKMSGRGFILFHDTNVRERDFGVWRLWLELEQRYPGFDFPHGNGLGIVFVGNQPMPVLSDLFSMPKEQKKMFIEFFHFLGNQYTVTKEQEQKIQNQSQRLIVQNEQIQILNEQLAEQDQVISEQDQVISEKDQVINEILISKAWKIVLLLRRIKEWFVPPVSRREGFMGLGPVNSYLNWIRENTPSPEDLERHKKISARWDPPPLFSVIIYFSKPEKKIIQNFLNSLQAQTCSSWELCIAMNSEFVETTMGLFENENYKVVKCDRDRSIPECLNDAFNVSKGDYVIFMDDNSVISPDMFFEVASLIRTQPEVDLIYFDEDQLVENDRKRGEPWFKPGHWSPEMLLSVNYLKHSVMRRSLIEQIGKFDNDVNKDYMWDLVFRFTEKSAHIAHIPKILYHQNKPSWNIKDNPRQLLQLLENNAIRTHLKRLGFDEPEVINLTYNIKRVLWKPKSEKVSIIIPNKNSPQLLENCISSILNKTVYTNYEIIVVDNQSTNSETLDFYEKLAERLDVKIIPFSESFNYSRANNIGAENASGEILLFLNNDIEIMKSDWLEELVRWAEIPEVGVVGAKLLYPDGKIQHAGIVIGMLGHANHIYYGSKNHETSLFGSLNWYRNYMAVTGACMMMRRSVFEEIGGFDENYLLAFSDVEICLRIIEHGYRIVYTPFAELLHYEGKSRKSHVPVDDMKLALEHMKDIIRNGDPYYNSNLSYSSYCPALAASTETDRLIRIQTEIKKQFFTRKIRND